MNNNKNNANKINIQSTAKVNNKQNSSFSSNNDTESGKVKQNLTDNSSEKQSKPQSNNSNNSNKRNEILMFLKFLGFSLSAGAIQIGAFTLLNEIAHIAYWPAYLVALLLSIVWNFTLNRKFTFKSAKNVPIAMTKVLMYYAVFTPLSTLWGDALTNIGWNEYVVLFITMVINFITEYLFQKFCVFNKKPLINKKPQYHQINNEQIDINKLKKWKFAGPIKYSNHLYSLVLSGQKTATSYLYKTETAFNDNKPINDNNNEISKLSVLTNWLGNKQVLIKSIKECITPFNEITSTFAEKEGEGDKSLLFWQNLHKSYFIKNGKKNKITFNDSTLILCEEFEVIKVLK